MQELARIIERHTGKDGVVRTAIEPLWLYRSSYRYEQVRTSEENQPVLCLIAQGSKQLVLGDEVYRYDPSRYLLASVDLPIVSALLDATPEVPYLGIRLALDPAMIGALLLEDDEPNSLHSTPPVRGMAVTEIDPCLLDAIVRLMRLLDTPRDIRVLSPLILREIIYRLLGGAQRARLAQIAAGNSRTQGVAQAIDWLKRHYARPLLVEDIAREVNMSASSLHHHFKAVTTLSPLQYQKRLRLNEARRLLLGESLDVATASYRVGYESPTQFSREYSRLFGAPPLRDISRLRGTG